MSVNSVSKGPLPAALSQTLQPDARSARKPKESSEPTRESQEVKKSEESEKTNRKIAEA